MNDCIFFVCQRYEERVIIISSKENDAGGISDAEKALLQIASLILAVLNPVFLSLVLI